MDKRKSNKLVIPQANNVIMDMKQEIAEELDKNVLIDGFQENKVTNRLLDQAASQQGQTMPNDIFVK